MSGTRQRRMEWNVIAWHYIYIIDDDANKLRVVRVEKVKGIADTRSTYDYDYDFANPEKRHIMVIL